jgi:putative transcriptional regulator
MTFKEGCGVEDGVDVLRARPYKPRSNRHHGLGDLTMYHYKSCGLDNVFLKNGFVIKQTPYGQAVAIEDVEGLHLAIASDLLRQKTPLTGAQFRFLRKEQDLTQAEMAAILGVGEQTVAAWEKLKSGQVQRLADIAMRAYYLAHRQAGRGSDV